MASYKLEISQLAEREYVSAFRYYEKQVSGLGIRFEKETGHLLDKIRSNPFLFQRRFKHYREAVYKTFPYFIVYEVMDDIIVIHSFFHAKRSPEKKLKKE